MTMFSKNWLRFRVLILWSGCVAFRKSLLLDICDIILRNALSEKNLCAFLLLLAVYRIQGKHEKIFMAWHYHLYFNFLFFCFFLKLRNFFEHYFVLCGK